MPHTSHQRRRFGRVQFLEGQTAHALELGAAVRDEREPTSPRMRRNEQIVGTGHRSSFLQVRPAGGCFVDFVWKRDELARYGPSISDAQMVVRSAIGGDTVTTTIEGRERYRVSVRYFRDYRSDVERLRHVLVPTMSGQAQIPIEQLADVRVVSGPAMLRNGNGMLNGPRQSSVIAAQFNGVRLCTPLAPLSV